jgi:hypothetical protein
MKYPDDLEDSDDREDERGNYLRIPEETKVFI